MTIFDANIPLLHRSWIEGTEKDSHGNVEGGLGDPVPRKAIAIWPTNRTLMRGDVVSPNVVARTETDIMVAVDDASIYHNRDQIIVYDMAFNIQGEPGLSGWDAMPISGYEDMVPSEVHAKRVT